MTATRMFDLVEFRIAPRFRAVLLFTHAPCGGCKVDAVPPGVGRRQRRSRPVGRALPCSTSLSPVERRDRFHDFLELFRWQLGVDRQTQDFPRGELAHGKVPFPVAERFETRLEMQWLRV